LSLGTGVVSPLDLALAYSIFPGAGDSVRARSIISVLDGQESEVSNHPVDRSSVIPATVAFQMTSLLRDVIARGTGSPARAWGLREAYGGKTGTTDDYHDAWFVGFSSKVVAAVWVGFDQPAPIGRDAYGARVALPIWAEFMKRTARILPPDEFLAPSGLTAEELCSESYLRPVSGCPRYTEYFKAGDPIPSTLCSIHRGTFEQQVKRTVEGIFRTLGSRIARIFRR
jgi:membrane carboxypeptidase/penicillin-binding protein